MIGIDEVGRGCWAGPLLVVATRQTCELPHGLDDSKKVSPSKRLALAAKIAHSCDIGEGWVSVHEIDGLGLAVAMRLGVARALQAIDAHSDEAIIMDGPTNYCPDQFKQVTCAPKADALYPVVSAASIYAKVTRDEYMKAMVTEHPDYGFESHVGYGTKQHQLALASMGPCDLHRMSFRPVAAYAKD